MIKANELRVGNLLNLKERKNNKGEDYPGLRGPFKVEQIKKNWAYARHVPDSMPFGLGLDQLEGIVLTPDVMQKIGFNRLSIENLPDNWYNQGTITLEYKGECFRFVGCLSQLDYINIIHLHQLQNILFAITGEEITFNFKQ